MTKKELWKEFNDKHADHFMYLWERWQDEKKYEDFNEYFKSMQKRVPQVIKMTKRPFAVTCECSDGKILIQCKSEGKYLRIVGKSVK